jgi:hypothetical protein
MRIVIIFYTYIACGVPFVQMRVCVCVCLSAVHIAVYRLYSCSLQVLLLEQSNEITCSFPAMYGDGTITGSGGLLLVKLYCKMADVDKETVACSANSNINVVLTL